MESTTRVGIIPDFEIGKFSLVYNYMNLKTSLLMMYVPVERLNKMTIVWLNETSSHSMVVGHRVSSLMIVIERIM